MWKAYLQSISNRYICTKPASSARIKEVEKKFNVKLPEEFRSLLEETDGVSDDDTTKIVWSLEEVMEENEMMRNTEDIIDNFMPFDHLLFIGGNGIGDLFGYAIINGEIQRDDIFKWDHEDDSRTWVAPSLRTFMQWWHEEKIEF